MTSISILSGAIARIDYLMSEPPQSRSLSDDAKKLQEGLKSIMAALQDANQQTKRTEDFAQLERKIVELSYDIVVTFGCKKQKGGVKLNDLIDELGNLKKKLEKEKEKEQKSGQSQEKEKDVTDSEQKSDQSNPASTGEDLHQMEEQVTAALLKPPSKESSVVCMQGKSGMGKSTLARKVFYRTEVRQSFKAFAWVPINQNLQIEKVLESLLQQLEPYQKVDIKKLDENNLIQHIFKVMEQKKCLILLDNICTEEDWQSVQVALRTDRSSKILITTPSKEVAEEAAHKDATFHIPHLSKEECFKMLEKEASFSKDVFVPELQAVWETIYDISEGSPLIALILGKSLKTEGGHMELDYDKSQKEAKALRVCYERLAHELKPCLLFLGQFPPGQNVEVEKLYLLLAAEDLISGSMQSVGDIFKELACKTLAEVLEEKVSKIGMNASCRLLDAVREFCISQLLHEKFFEIVDFKNEKKISTLTRRLAIYMSKCRDGKPIRFSSQDTVKKIRSLLIFDAYKSAAQSTSPSHITGSTWPSNISDLNEFSHLTVLDFDRVNFKVRKVPKGIGKMVFLRYLSFRGCWLEALPSLVSKLAFLETLDLRVDDKCKMIISNIIFNMKRLRHLYFPKLYKADGKSKLQLQGLQRLEILVNFDTEACQVEDLKKLKSDLKILTTISEHQKELEAINEYLESAEATSLQYSSLEIRNFKRHEIGKVVVLKELLKCKSLNSIHIEGLICTLPNDVILSEKFTEIVLIGSQLEPEPIMTKLGEIKELQSLVLSNNAFLGSEMWISAATKFLNLRSLKLLNLEYLTKLTITEGAMPALSTLVINECGRLKELNIQKELHDRLQKAQEQNEGDVYSVFPFPPIDGS